MPSANSVITDYYSLTPTEQNTVKSELLSPSFSRTMDVKQYVEKSRFSDGRVCPICGCNHVKRNGTRKSKTSSVKVQRYLCLECGKSFVITANSIAAGTRKGLDVWEKFIDCMMNGFSIRKTAMFCGIHKNTAFYWRHKVLDALQHMMEAVKMKGIIEADETFFDISYKGNHKKSTTFVMSRSSHHRGKSVKKRGLSNEKVCVPCAVNRDGLSLAKVANLARVKIDGLKGVFDGKMESGSVMITDKASAYRKFSKDNGLKLYALKSGYASCKGLYHLQNINSYHSRLKSFIGNFKGVSTKYLNNYLVWHNFLNYSKEDYFEKKRILLEYVFSIPHTIVCRDLPVRESLPLVA